MVLTDYDWDKYFAKLSSYDLRLRSPMLAQYRHPSVYNHDNTLFYLSSLDLGVSVLDKKGLLSFLDEVKERYESGHLDEYKKVAAYFDYHEIIIMLSNLGEYISPEI